MSERIPVPPTGHSTEHLVDAQLKELLRRNTGALPEWADERTRRLWAELGR